EGTPVSGTAASEKDWEARLWEDSVLLPYAGDTPRPSPLGDEESAPRPPAPTPVPIRTDDEPAATRRPDEAPGVSRPDAAPGVNRQAEAVTRERWEDPGAQDGATPQRTRDADETGPERALPLVGPPPPPPRPSPPGRPGPSAKED